VRFKNERFIYHASLTLLAVSMFGCENKHSVTLGLVYIVMNINFLKLWLHENISHEMSLAFKYAKSFFLSFTVLAIDLPLACEKEVFEINTTFRYLSYKSVDSVCLYAQWP